MLKCDVRKYFASIDHDILKAQLERVIKCRPTLEPAARIIDGSNTQDEVIQYFPGDTLFTPFSRRRGLPLGNQTSQFFANVYINGLDHLIDEALRPRVWARYVDDLVFFDWDKDRLRAMRARMEQQLDGLRLTLHSKKSRIHRCADGVTFLGWRLFPGGRARLVRSSVVRFGRRMRRLEQDFADGTADWEAVGQSVRAWIAHAAFGNTQVLRKAMLERFVFVRGARPSRAGGVVQQ